MIKRLNEEIKAELGELEKENNEDEIKRKLSKYEKMVVYFNLLEDAAVDFHEEEAKEL